MNKTLLHSFAQILYFFIVAIAIWSIYGINDGHLIYTLDDPYIHLAVSESIANLNYGVNSQEYSAPSSSILWPYLLTVLEIVFFRVIPLEFIPLFINIVCGSLLIYTLHLHIKKNFGENYYITVFLLSFLFFIAATNIFGLIFIGMEHSLQIITLVGIAYLLINTKKDNYPTLLYVLLFLAPFIRYENMAVTFTVIAFLLYKKQFMESVLTAALTLSGLVLFSVYLKTIGLDYMPTSILIKSGAMSDSFVTLLIDKVVGNLSGSITFTILYSLALFSIYHNAKHKPLALSLAIAMTLHLVFGRTGWFYRYEMYIVAYSFTILLYLYKDEITRFLSEKYIASFSIFILATLFLNIGVIFSQLFLAQASNNIYSQQYLMSKIAKEYSAPVGVNDLGLVAYKNNNYVLDLYGLASKRAMVARINKDTEQMESLCREYNVGLIMIYDNWFKEIPKSWKKVATLSVSGRIVAPIGKSVSFYTTGIDDNNVLLSLKKFKQLDWMKPEKLKVFSTLQQ